MEDKKINWFKWPLEHYSISLLLVIIFFFMGIYGMYVMPKDEFPAFTIRQGVVIGVYPGATAEEVEEQLTKPLERYLFTYQEVNRTKTTSTSQNGMCIIMVRLNDDVNNKDEVWSKVKHGVNNLKASLPSGVLTVMVNDDFGNTSALLIAMESAQRSYRELHEYTDQLSDRLRRIESVANVNTYGDKKEQISLYIDRQRLQAYGIGQQTLLSQLQAQGLTTMSGSIVSSTQQTPIHVDPIENNEEEIANTIIFNDASTGKVVRVRDVARVVREYDLSESYIEQNGHPCVLISMEMVPGNNIVMYGNDVDKVLDEFRQDVLPDDVTITRIADQPKVVSDSVSSFLRDLLISMLVIVVVMLLLFPIRSAIVAAITVPVSTFISVSVMYMFGIELNMVTLAALIVVLGMVVDNSIVVIDGYLEYIGKGIEPKKAAIDSAKQYFMPMLLATLCICIIFYPLLYTMKGAFNDAMQDFPLTITINLMVSLLLAVLVIPFLEVLIIKPEKVLNKKKDKRSLTDIVQQTYDKILAITFRHPWATIAGGIGVVILSSIIVPSLKIRMFPYADREQFAVEVFLPDSKSLDDTRLIADSLRQVLQADKDVTNITSFIGCASPRFQVTYAPQMAGRNYAQFIVNTTSQEATLQLLAKYQSEWSEAYPNAYIRFKRLDYLEVPELEYRFYGDDIDALHEASEQLMARMREMPEVEWVHSDFFNPYPIINVKIDPVVSSQLGINRATTSLGLATVTNDMQVGEIWEGDYNLPIVMKNSNDITYSDIENLGITSPISMISSALQGISGDNAATNGSVPLRQFAKVAPAWKESRIMHRSGERCLTVTGQFAQGVYAAPIESRIADIMENELDLPDGVRAEVGGEIEYDAEAIPQIFGGVAISMVIIFFFLLFNFKKYGITTVCIAALGLMLPGTLIGLGLMGRTLGLTSVMGVITLMGMIMRNEILIFEHANDLVKKFVNAHPRPAVVTPDMKRAYYKQYNQAVKQAAMDAGSRRMVPIFLTTATTAVGVVPMILAQTSFWMPVGVTIFAGGIGSLIMVVTVLPVVYWKVSTK
ncbi:MAG: efflux RND transporter permease subunit [Bacteroidaceae bacterium]|nr:efflux RND transporter permease subunit [Bacteroidaceae bacterium]